VVEGSNASHGGNACRGSRRKRSIVLFLITWSTA
jgi:hypothetical protein